MTRYLTGITPSGKPHLGNVLGAILPALEFSKNLDNECFYFISDLHSLTTVKKANDRILYTRAIASAWLAFGFDIDKNFFYRQSRISVVTQLAWILNCITPFSMLTNAHAFKDKSANLEEINAGLFTYPVLMAADILLFDANFVPVGKDQKQHVEITRDIAIKFNNRYGETFVIPKPLIKDEVQTIPGIDGRKMSKSYSNYIDIFETKDNLKNQIFGIVTDSTPYDQPKDPNTCNIFKIFELVAGIEAINEMREKYESGNYGYGDAKKELLEVLWNKYKNQRELFNFYMSNPDKLEEVLLVGEKKAKIIADQVMDRIKDKIGFPRLF